MEQLEFDFMKEERDKFIIYDEKNNLYPFNLFFSSEEEALAYLTIRLNSLDILSNFKVHKFIK